jgi:probable addiction module antidote protein|tara:strand:- start:185 stop:475 length:291 start_codon:yes stop_codon:yes gene_type:complete
MKTQTKPLDIRDFLHSDEEIAEYINEAYHDENPRMFLIALGNVVRSKGVSKVAQETGLGRESLYKVFSGSASPKWDTLKKLLDNLGIEINMQANSA